MEKRGCADHGIVQTPENPGRAALRRQGAAQRHQVLDREPPFGQVGQTVEEGRRREIGKKPKPAGIDSQHGRRVVVHPAGCVQDGSVAPEHHGDIGR